MYNSNVTVWTRVCMAPMTQFHIWLWSWQTKGVKGHKAREQLHTAVQQPLPGTASVNTWLTYTLSSVGWRSGYCWRVLAAEDYHQLSLAIPLIAGHISSSVTSFCRTPIFVRLWFANCKQTQQDGQITDMRAWLKVNYRICCRVTWLSTVLSLIISVQATA